MKYFLLHLCYDENGELIITNPEDVKAYYQYPDLTLQTIFLAKAIQETIKARLVRRIVVSEKVYY